MDGPRNRVLVYLPLPRLSTSRRSCRVTFTVSPAHRAALQLLEEQRREWAASRGASEYNGVNADDAGDSSAAANRIDSTIAPADQLSPGSVGVTRAIEGIVR
jgi:hypothetical protein